MINFTTLLQDLGIETTDIFEKETKEMSKRNKHNYKKEDKNKLRYTTASGHSGDGDWIENCEHTYSFDKADIVIFEGGTDISPTLYGEKDAIQTQVNKIQPRDEREIALYERAKNAGKMCFGICRGMQLLSVLNGAKLVQHMRHPGSHQVKTWDGKTITTNSLHHQLVYPWLLKKEDYELTMWTEGLSNTYLNGDNEENDFPFEAFTDDASIIEPEGIWFPKTRSMAVQFHPEMMGWSKWAWDSDDNTLDYLNKLLRNLFENPNYIKEQKLQLVNQ